MSARTRKLLDQLDTFDLDVDAKVLTLSVAQRQRVEIAKALSKNARVLIMDEPTASLVESDVQRLMTVVRQLRQRGVAIVYVSHRLSEIFALADRVTVLRDGAHVGDQGHRRGQRAAARLDDGRPADRQPVPQDRRRDRRDGAAR